MNEAKQPPIRIGRVASALIYLALGCLMIYLRHASMFYSQALPPSDNLWDMLNGDRFVWCLASSFLGFAFLVFQLLRHEEPVVPSYISYYPVLLILISGMVFGVLHIIPQTSSFVFYYLSLTLCFILSFRVDYFWSVTTEAIERLAKKSANA